MWRHHGRGMLAGTHPATLVPTQSSPAHHIKNNNVPAYLTHIPKHRIFLLIQQYQFCIIDRQKMGPRAKRRGAHVPTRWARAYGPDHQEHSSTEHIRVQHCYCSLPRHDEECSSIVRPCMWGHAGPGACLPALSLVRMHMHGAASLCHHRHSSQCLHTLWAHARERQPIRAQNRSRRHRAPLTGLDHVIGARSTAPSPAGDATGGLPGEVLALVLAAAASHVLSKGRYKQLRLVCRAWRHAIDCAFKAVSLTLTHQVPI